MPEICSDTGNLLTLSDCDKVLARVCLVSQIRPSCKIRSLEKFVLKVEEGVLEFLEMGGRGLPKMGKLFLKWGWGS